MLWSAVAALTSAFSAWGALLALSGFLYDHPGKHVQAKPRIHAENFQSFWSAGAGWGVFSNAVRESNPVEAPAPVELRGSRTHCAGLPLANRATAIES